MFTSHAGRRPADLGLRIDRIDVLNSRHWSATPSWWFRRAVTNVKVSTLDLGADDYIVKLAPQISRADSQPSSTAQGAGRADATDGLRVRLEIDFGRRIVTRDGFTDPIEYRSWRYY